MSKHPKVDMISPTSSSASSAELVIVGGGEHAVVVADAARAAGWTIRGFSEVRNDGPLADLGVKFLGDDDHVAKEHSDACFVLSVGGQELRRRIAAKLEAARVRFAAVIHPRATVSSTAHVTDGAVVFAGAVVNPGARIASHAIINTAAVVEHDVVIGRLVHVSPAAAIGGGAVIEDGAVIGLGARVRDHVTVRTDAFVGMGSVVVDDVPAGQTVMGVPARERRGRREAIA